MIRIFQVGIGLLFSCALSSTTLIAQESLADLESFRTGCVALEDGRYETAATAFEEAWSQLLESDSGEVALDFVGSRYLEALVRNGRSGAALRWSAKNRPTPSSFATLKWTAIAHQDEQRFSEAAQIYSDLSAELPEPDPTLRLNHAICLSLSGRPEAGFTLLSGFSPRSDLEALQFARIALDAGALDEAQATLETLRRSEALSPEIDFAALALQCWISEKRNLPSAPIGEILGFIEEAESEETALEGLLLLEEITTTRTRLPIRPELDRLADSREAPTARPASLFRVLWFSDQEERLPALQAWVESLDDSPARAERTSSSTKRVPRLATSFQEGIFGSASTTLEPGSKRSSGRKPSAGSCPSRRDLQVRRGLTPCTTQPSLNWARRTSNPFSRSSMN
jgi:hypothetical protein